MWRVKVWRVKVRCVEGEIVGGKSVKGVGWVSGAQSSSVEQVNNK